MFMALILQFNSLYTEFSHPLQLQNTRSDRPRHLSCQWLGNRLPHRPPREVRVQGGRNLSPEHPLGLGGCPRQTSPHLQYMMIQTQSSTATDLLAGGEKEEGPPGKTSRTRTPKFDDTIYAIRQDVGFGGGAAAEEEVERNGAADNTGEWPSEHLVLHVFTK